MGVRYFPATALGGRLYIDRIGGHWDAGWLAYQEEGVVDVLVARISQRKIVTVEELKRLLRESEGGLPAIRAWLSEGLEDAARGLCG